MKKLFAILLSLFLLLCPLTAFAAEEIPDVSDFELPQPAAPAYLMYEAADRTATEGDDALYVVRQADMSVLALASEYDADRDVFLEKYGLYDFLIIMQYDTSLDGTDNWNYTSEWDTDYAAPGAGEAAGIFWIGEMMMEKQTIFDLYECAPDGDAYSNMADAILQRDVPYEDYTFNNFYFDYENHSLYIRVRYYMQWQTWDGETIGDTQSKFSQWSDVAIFGKDGNSITPEAPTGYEAPVISDLQYVQPGEGSELGYLTFLQETPEQVWHAGVYYEMTGDGYFEGLETQISIDGGDWQPYQTINSGGNWCLLNGLRSAQLEEPRIEAGSHVKLRIRFLGAHGPSEWSNVLELNGGGTQEVPTEPTSPPATQPAPAPTPVEEAKCGICGFCPEPLGLCIFIWLAIALLVILIIIILVTRPRKCKNCGRKLKKDEKQCPNCGAAR